MKTTLKNSCTDKKTPKYRQQSTQAIGPPNTEIISAHLASNLGPKRIHEDFLTLTLMSISINSLSQASTRICKPETLGEISKMLSAYKNMLQQTQDI